MKINCILTVSVLLAAPVLASAATNDLPTLLQHGLFEEEANHQLDAAIGNYKEAIKHFDHERLLAATAIFHLGECYRKLGRTNEANAQYERLVREFPDQPQFAQLSRAYLPAGTGATTASTTDASGLPPDEEKFLREVKESVQNSPDLVNQQLMIAADKGYVSAAEFLLAHGADVNLQSPIVRAASQGNEAMVELLLSHGAAVNKEKEGQTALSAAVDSGYMTVCRTLLAHGADPNLQSRIRTAIGNGNEAMVQLLLSNGQAVNDLDNSGRTPLFTAVDKGIIPICQALVAHGADVNAKDKQDWTPLHRAAEIGSLPAVEFLITNKAQMDAADNKGWTPLHVAVGNNDLSLAELLITNKAQIDVKTLWGQTPLFIAMSHDDTNMVKLLLDNHADANMETSIGTRWQITPLAWAIYLNHPDLVKLLVEGHADPNAVITSHAASDTFQQGSDGPNWMVMHNRLRPRTGTDEWEQKWVEPIAGLTPLLWTTWGHPPQAAEMVKLLLDHGANANLVDPNGYTALMHAIGHEKENLDMVQTLIAHGADVNALDKEGRPLLAQMQFSLTETGRQIQDLLIKAGADEDYNRRRGIWVSDAGGKPKNELFKCPTNSINHYTLLETLATLYQVNPTRRQLGGQENWGRYAHPDDFVPFPDFARVAIHRLDGKRAEVLHVNVADIFQSGDRSKDVAMQAGDLVEIPKEEHKVADKWYGLPAEDVTGLNKCLLRTVRIIAKGHTHAIELLPSLATADDKGRNIRMPQGFLDTSYPERVAEALNSKKADILVRSLFLNNVVGDENILLNTWDLSRVRLKRGGTNTTFDLTANPRPEVLLEDGDVIEIPELGEAAPVTQAK
jgi:ankyrin repeat protein